MERGRENLAYYAGLLGDDLRLQAVQPVAVGHGGGGEDAPLHSHPDAGAHIAGVIGGFHLGEARVDGGRLLRGELAGVDVLLLEADGDAQARMATVVCPSLRSVFMMALRRSNRFIRAHLPPSDPCSGV